MTVTYSMILTLATIDAQAAWYAAFLPQSVKGWIASGPVREYDRTNIFDYMGDAGEPYLAYGLKSVAVREYAKSGVKISAEVYRIGSSQDAYGIFSSERRHAVACPAIGRDSEYAMGLLRFWKGPYFVRILAERETPDSKAMVLALGNAMSQGISSEGTRPALANELAKAGLIPESVLYFHKHTVLNRRFHLSDANILNLSENTDAVLAQYKLGDHKLRLLVVRYPGAAATAAARAQFESAYFDGEPASTETARVENAEGGEFTGVQLRGKTLRLVFEAATEEQCRKLLEGR